MLPAQEWDDVYTAEDFWCQLVLIHKWKYKENK
jgi:hypothetical protein